MLAYSTKLDYHWTFSREPCQITLCQILCRNTFKFIVLVVLDVSTVPSALFITLSLATIVDGHVIWGNEHRHCSGGHWLQEEKRHSYKSYCAITPGKLSGVY